MITFHRTSTLTSGDVVRAMSWAREIAAYIRQSTGVDVAVEMPVGRNPWQLRWSFKYDNLAAYDAKTSELRADPKYMAMLASGSDMFVPNTTDDELWRSI